jgi:hypothetical protein
MNIDFQLVPSRDTFGDYQGMSLQLIIDNTFARSILFEDMDSDTNLSDINDYYLDQLIKDYQRQMPASSPYKHLIGPYRYVTWAN